MADEVGVLIVDDSAVVRHALTEQLSRQRGIRVLGSAPDPYIARDKIVALRPDLITLDIEMPRMDGLTFLRKLMKHHPVPTIVVSSLTQKGTATAIACLEAGAIEVLAKPGESYSIGDLAQRIAEIARGARRIRPAMRTPDRVATAPARPAAPHTAMLETTEKVVAIGASTGGTHALRDVLTALPKQSPGIAIVQHMPAGFTTSFANRLNELCDIEVREAADGDAVVPGVALLAPGDLHTRLARDGARYIVRVGPGPRVRRHRPSVEVLFESFATYAGANAMGVILTGMGDDGATGMLKMREAGAVTLAQNEQSCVVYGMPRAAVECGGAAMIEPLDRVAARITEFARGRLHAAA